MYKIEGFKKGIVYRVLTKSGTPTTKKNTGRKK